MLKTVISNRRLIPLSLALAASAGMLTATPAQAGPLDFIKKEVTKAAKKEAKRQVETRAAGGYLHIGDIKGEAEAASQDGGGGIFNEGGTVSIDRTNRPAGGVRVAAGDVNLDSSDAGAGGGPHVKVFSGHDSADTSGGARVRVLDGRTGTERGATSQNGTTVATANEVQAPETRQERAKLKQTGTTVETASEVQAPQDEQAGLLLPAVQKVREAAAR